MDRKWFKEAEMKSFHKGYNEIKERLILNISIKSKFYRINCLLKFFFFKLKQNLNKNKN